MAFGIPAFLVEFGSQVRQLSSSARILVYAATALVASLCLLVCHVIASEWIAIYYTIHGGGVSQHVPGIFAQHAIASAAADSDSPTPTLLSSVVAAGASAVFEQQQQQQQQYQQQHQHIQYLQQQQPRIIFPVHASATAARDLLLRLCTSLAAIAIAKFAEYLVRRWWASEDTAAASRRRGRGSRTAPSSSNPSATLRNRGTTPPTTKPSTHANTANTANTVNAAPLPSATGAAGVALQARNSHASDDANAPVTHDGDTNDVNADTDGDVDAGSPRAHVTALSVAVPFLVLLAAIGRLCQLEYAPWFVVPIYCVCFVGFVAVPVFRRRALRVAIESRERLRKLELAREAQSAGRKHLRIGVYGRQGAGKTSLIKELLRVRPDDTHNGALVVGGNSGCDLRSFAFDRHVTIVEQRSLDLAGVRQQSLDSRNIDYAIYVTRDPADSFLADRVKRLVGGVRQVFVVRSFADVLETEYNLAGRESVLQQYLLTTSVQKVYPTFVRGHDKINRPSEPHVTGGVEQLRQDILSSLREHRAEELLIHAGETKASRAISTIAHACVAALLESRSRGVASTLSFDPFSSDARKATRDIAEAASAEICEIYNVPFVAVSSASPSSGASAQSPLGNQAGNRISGQSEAAADAATAASILPSELSAIEEEIGVLGASLGTRAFVFGASLLGGATLGALALVPVHLVPVYSVFKATLSAWRDARVRAKDPVSLDFSALWRVFSRADVLVPIAGNFSDASAVGSAIEQGMREAAGGDRAVDGAAANSAMGGANSPVFQLERTRDQENGASLHRVHDTTGANANARVVAGGSVGDVRGLPSGHSGMAANVARRKEDDIVRDVADDFNANSVGVGGVSGQVPKPTLLRAFGRKIAGTGPPSLMADPSTRVAVGGGDGGGEGSGSTRVESDTRERNMGIAHNAGSANGSEVHSGGVGVFGSSVSVSTAVGGSGRAPAANALFVAASAVPRDSPLARAMLGRK